MYIRLTIALCLLLVSYGYGQKRKGPPPGTTTTTATTTATTTTTAVSTFCSDVMSDDGTTDVDANEYCGSDDAVGYMEVCEDGDDMYILTSGAPDYETKGPWCERWQYVKVSQTWEDSGSTYTAMGALGYLFAGGVNFDHRSSTDGSSAIYWEGYMLDDYNGHSNAVYQYHYHGIPEEYESAADSSACQLLGYMIDGGKLYGYCEVDGVQLASCYYADSTGELDYVGIEESEDDYTFNSEGSDCHLDECNMYELNGEMVYITSANWPFVPPCLKGSASTIYGFTPSVRPS